MTMKATPSPSGPADGTAPRAGASQASPAGAARGAVRAEFISAERAEGSRMAFAAHTLPHLGCDLVTQVSHGTSAVKPYHAQSSGLLSKEVLLLLQLGKVILFRLARECDLARHVEQPRRHRRGAHEPDQSSLKSEPVLRTVEEPQLSDRVESKPIENYQLPGACVPQDDRAVMAGTGQADDGGPDVREH